VYPSLRCFQTSHDQPCIRPRCLLSATTHFRPSFTEPFTATGYLASRLYVNPVWTSRLCHLAVLSLLLCFPYLFFALIFSTLSTNLLSLFTNRLRRENNQCDDLYLISMSDPGPLLIYAEWSKAAGLYISLGIGMPKIEMPKRPR
jgi:hypothetical protein